MVSCTYRGLRGSYPPRNVRKGGLTARWTRKMYT